MRPRPTTDRRLVQAALVATGLSQVALARVLHVDASTLRRWLSGALALHGPARQLCRALAYDPHLVSALGADE